MITDERIAELRGKLEAAQRDRRNIKRLCKILMGISFGIAVVSVLLALWLK